MIKDDRAARPVRGVRRRPAHGAGRTLAPEDARAEALRRRDPASTVTFAIGPAGTGKTYLAVATAVKALQEREISRIILTRPAVEAGERLGFLPGTLYEKIDPYLKPLYDALFEMMDAEALPRLMERGTIEVAPLAYMRGRTLNDSFIILDEAQNTTPEQMKMFLTRLGFGSKAVVNGDVTQIDLPTGSRVRLVVVEEILDDIEGIEFVPPRRRATWSGTRSCRTSSRPTGVYGEQQAARARRADVAARGRRRPTTLGPNGRAASSSRDRQTLPVDEARAASASRGRR